MNASFAAVALRLTDFAQAIARARIEELRLERRDPAARWRKASLLWPLFTKG
jgi:hypothetical protein